MLCKKYQHIRQRLNQMGTLETELRNRHFRSYIGKNDKTFIVTPEGRKQVSFHPQSTNVCKLNDKHQAVHVDVYDNDTGGLWETIEQKFDDHNRLVHLISRSNYSTEEKTFVYAEDITVIHTNIHYNFLFKEDVYVVEIYDELFGLVCTYSSKTGNLLHIQRISLDEDTITEVDYLPNGIVHKQIIYG